MWCLTLAVGLKKAANIAIRSLSPNKPYHVQWMVTRRCNYRCRGCNVWQEQDTRELSTEKIKKGLDILKNLGVVEIVFSGGNPLMREDMGEIIKYASRSFMTTVYDNGSIAGQKIEALRPASFVAISIDSLDPKKNDHIKGVSGSLERAMQTVEKLREAGIRVSVTPTISKLNIHEIVDITQYFLKREVPIWYCLYSFDSSDDGCQLFKIGKQNDEFVITDKQAMVRLCDAIMEMKKKNSHVLMTDKLLEAIKAMYSGEGRTWQCQALQSFFMIDHTGRVAGCHLHDPVTSIFDLPKVWNSQTFDDLRKTYRSCSRCTYLCYVFYSLHGNVRGNLQLAQERWRSATLFLKKKKS